MTIRLLRNGDETQVAEKHFAIEEGDTMPINTRHDEKGNLIIDIITGSDLIEVLDSGINTYIFSEKTNSWKLI